MILPSLYYEEKLYPLQDGVMNTISRCGVRFFLTGGTALSRAYYNHRYSDDLDFFVNSDDEYEDQVKEVFYKLKEDGFFGVPKQILSAIKHLPVLRWVGISQMPC